MIYCYYNHLIDIKHFWGSLHVFEIGEMKEKEAVIFKLTLTYLCLKVMITTKGYMKRLQL